jgi:MOSC domain-containing protein YiiM
VITRHWGHSDFGVYAQVVAQGTVAVGDGISLI